MTYEVEIRLLNSIEYKGVFSFEDGKIYIRSMIDEEEYEKMFWELIKRGDVKVAQDGDNYIINVETFSNNLLDIFEHLIDDGFELEYQEVRSDSYSFSLIADGDDLNPNVIAHISKGSKFIQLAESLFKYTNNADYEPKINVRASSYAVDVQDVDSNNTLLEQLIDDINNKIIDIDKYFNDKKYSKLIDSLFDVVGVETLKNLSISFDNISNRSKNISITTIKSLKKEFKNMLNRREFLYTINSNQLRAFDDKKKRAVLDIAPVHHLHFLEDSLYEAIHDKYLKSSKNIIISGYYKSKQTVVVTSIK